MSQNSRRPLVYRLLGDLLQTLGWRYWLMVALILGLGLTVLLPPQLFRFFTERSQSLGGVTAATFLIQLVSFGILISGALLLSTLGRTFCSEWLRIRLEGELRRRVLHQLQRIRLSSIDVSQRGDWLTRMTEELSESEIFLTEVIPAQIRNLAVVLGTLILFLAHSGWVAAFAMGTALVVIAINLRVQKKIAPLLADLRQLHGGVFQILIETFESARTLRSHGAGEFVNNQLETKLQGITAKSLLLVRALGWLTGGTELVAQLCLTACLTFAALSLTGGKISVEQALVYPFFIGLFYGSVQALAAAAYQWNRFVIEGGRIAELLYAAHEEESQISDLSIPPHACQRLVLEDVYLRKGHSTQSLFGPVDLEIRRGEMVAVVGPSGSGKSTMLEVMAGLSAPLEGRVRLEDGQARTLWESEGSAPPLGLCAYVEQHPYLFEGTLRSNLTFSTHTAPSDLALWNALEKVGLHTFAKRNGGLDYLVIDQGRNLSEGERYRLALCRALLLERPFLLLDEPFAALDCRSRQKLVATLEDQKWFQGIVVVTHFIPEGFKPDRVFDFEEPAPSRLPGLPLSPITLNVMTE